MRLRRLRDVPTADILDDPDRQQVVLVLLHDWRVLVPDTTVPVTIIVAVAVMPLLGFTVNSLTLFGLVPVHKHGGF